MEKNQQGLRPGTILRGDQYIYRIDKILGQGAFGITYLATTEIVGKFGRLPVKVAVKEYFAKDLNSRSEDGSVRESSSDSLAGRYGRAFQREAVNLSHLNHPGIVSVLEAFQGNNTWYYAMEYIEGGSLDEYVTGRGGLPEQEALAAIREIGAALSFMHDNKMLHLDLKLKNVMRREDGRLVLIDFGLSKQYTADGEAESSTTIGLGTPGYAPLEQSQLGSGKFFSPALDIYALAATLFKLLTGKTPPTSSEVFNLGFPSEDLRKRGVSEQTIKAIEVGMTPQQFQRPQTVADFMKLLDGTLETDPTDNGAEEETILVGPGPKPKPEEFKPMPPTPAPKAPSVPVQKRSRRGLWIGLAVITVLAGVLIFLFVPRYKFFRTGTFGNKERFAVDNVPFTMVSVEGGTFVMGATPEQENAAYGEEKPVHSVMLSDFLIGETEVTQGLWKAVMENNPSKSRKGNKYPVNNVSYDDCMEFIQKLNEMFPSFNFRLPTEAEWEYAARGGRLSKGYRYAGNNDPDRAGWVADREGSMHPVAKKAPNELGLYDMTGNVGEWCSDWYGDYDSADQVNPRGAETGYYRVFRGGAWVTPYPDARLTVRFNSPPMGRDETQGFRLAMDPPIAE